MIAPRWWLILSLACSCSAQNTALVDVNVHVLRVDNRRMPEGTLIEAVNASGIVVSRAVTDRYSQAELGKLPPGCYQIRAAHEWVEASGACTEIAASPVPVTKEIYVQGQTARTPPNPIQPVISIASIRAPEAARTELAKGVRALQQDRFGEAALHANQALKIYANFPDAYNVLGTAQLRTGDITMAQTTFRTALRIDSQNADAHLNLARIAAAQKDFSEAERELNQVLQAGQNDSQTWTLLAFAQFEIQHYDDAIRSAERAHASEKGSSAAAHFVAASAMEKMGRFSEAILQLKIYVQEEPGGRYAERSREFIQRYSQKR
jgi:Tfp pilus assembly protein PilF